jgi:hypothetical protein
MGLWNPYQFLTNKITYFWLPALKNANQELAYFFSRQPVVEAFPLEVSRLSAQQSTGQPEFLVAVERQFRDIRINLQIRPK